jgi:hypothetical protein
LCASEKLEATGGQHKEHPTLRSIGLPLQRPNVVSSTEDSQQAADGAMQRRDGEALSNGG